MIEYNEVNVKLLDSQLNKLETAQKLHRSSFKNEYKSV